MARRTSLTNPWAVALITLSGLVLVVGVTAVGLVWLVAAVFFGSRTPNPEEATRAVVVKAVGYDECTRTVTGGLERHYEWHSQTPIDVTVTAYTPDGPTVGCRATTRQVMPSSSSFEIRLTDEQAAAFGHPDARRTVSLRRADGQLVQDETAWAK